MWLGSSLSLDDDELGESCFLWLYSWSQPLLMLHCPGGYSIERCVIRGAMGNDQDIGTIDFVHQQQGHLVAQHALVGSHPQRRHWQAHNHVCHMSGACGLPPNPQLSEDQGRRVEGEADQRCRLQQVGGVGHYLQPHSGTSQYVTLDAANAGPVALPVPSSSKQ
jgi:hypothetical protein